MKQSAGTWLRTHWTRLIAGSTWLLLLAAGIIWAVMHDLSPRDIAELVYNFVDTNPLAPLILLAIYALRSFTLFPAMWLTIAAGSLFGFFPGVIWAVIGENLSAHVAYATARFFAMTTRNKPTKPVV